MKNKRLSIILMLLALSIKQNNLIATECEQIQESSNKDIYSEKSKKENSSASKALTIIKNILKYGAYTVGGMVSAGCCIENGQLKKENARLKRVNNKFNGNDEAEEAMKEILSRVDQYKDLDYNGRVDGFLKEAEKIINEYKSNDKIEARIEIRDKEAETDKLWEKSSKETWHNSFRLIKNKKAVCRDYTYVFGKMARKLKIKCYPIFMLKKDGKNERVSGHSALLLTKENNNNNTRQTVWFVLDGANYDYFKKKRKTNNEGLLQPEVFFKDSNLNEYHEVFITPDMKADYPATCYKNLNEKDYQKMQEGYDLYFNKITGTWEYKKLEPVKN